MTKNKIEPFLIEHHKELKYEELDTKITTRDTLGIFDRRYSINSSFEDEKEQQGAENFNKMVHFYDPSVKFKIDMRISKMTTHTFKSAFSNYSMISYSSQDYAVNRCFIVSLILLSSAGTFFMGFNEAIFDTMEAELESVFGWKHHECEFELTLISVSITVGAAVGAFLSGFLTNYFGRKNLLLILDIVSIIGTILTLISNPYIIIAGRLIVGIGVGGFTNVSRLYMAEMSPIQLRAINIAVIEVFYMIGISIAYGLGFGLSISSHWWRVMFGFNIIIAGLHFLLTLLFFNFDTPIFHYIKTNELDETKAILQRIYRNPKDVDLVAREIKRISKEKIEQSNISYVTLFVNYRARTIICLLLTAGAIFIGVDTLIYFLDFILKKYMDKTTSTLLINLLGAIQLIASIIATLFVEHMGRKKILIIGHSVIMGTLSLLGVFYYLNITDAYIYLFGIIIAFNSLIINPVSNIYLTDVLPEKGLALCYTFYYLFKLALTSSFKPIISSFLGFHGLFWIYSFCTLLTLLFVIFKLKETHGKTLYQLDKLY